MTSGEAIEELKGAIIGCEYVDSEYSDCIKVDVLRIALKSLEAWDEVINHLEATAKELLDREDEKQSNAFAKGITFAVSMIKNHIKEVEE